MSLITATSRSGPEMPKAPVEIQDALELWARKAGRTGRMHFFPPAGWFARLELRPNDKRLIAFREGRAPEPETEDVFFHVRNPFDGQIMSMQEIQAHPALKKLPLIDWWNGRKVKMPGYLQLDILQMGAAGVTTYLEHDDTWSGRGEYASLEEATKKQQDKNAAGQAAFEQGAEERAGRRAHDLRRQLGKIPFLGVLIGESRPGNRKET